MMRILVSVRSVDEARIAAAGGADFIDLKEPRAGALGALPLDRVRDIVAALRAGGGRARISATIGDGPWTPGDAVACGRALAACGVDDVKVGVMPGEAPLLAALAGRPERIVPVFIADAGLDDALIGAALASGFEAMMLDTADKRAGSLFDCVPLERLQGFVQRVQRAGRQAGLAGALRLHHVPALLRLAPDFAGFRSAVCDGPREGRLDADRLAALRNTTRAAAANA